VTLVFTALLGIGSFVVQTRVAKDAEVAQQQMERARAEHDKARELAGVQLVRVWSQMGDVYRPVQVMIIQADVCAIYMQCELGFEFNDTSGYEFVRPFALRPHLEVTTHDFSPKILAVVKGSPYKKYSAADVALLDDPAKRQLYIEAHAGCIVPCWREVAAILLTKSALMEQTPPSYLDGAFSADGVDWTKFSAGSLSVHMQDMGAFAHAWGPLERRWEAGGALAIMRSYALPCSMPHCCAPLYESGLTVCGSIFRLLPHATRPAEPVSHREPYLHEDDQRGRCEGGQAPGFFERRARERDE
jgi:hypothetical protein